jgi:hypothetical protein
MYTYTVACAPGQQFLYLQNSYGVSRVISKETATALRATEAKDAVIETPCLNMTAKFAELGIVHIDFFSLDVEGSELTVVESIDWSQVKIDVILIENESLKEGRGVEGLMNKDQKIEEILVKKAGMVKMPVLGSDMKPCQLAKKGLKPG